MGGLPGPGPSGVLLGVVCGLDREAAWYRSATGHDTTGVRLVVGGMGPVRAAEAARELVASGVRALVSWGSAAGLDPTLAPGTLLVPGVVVPASGAPLAAHAGWWSALVDALSPTFDVVGEPLAEATGVLAAPEDKRALREATDAVAADMETAAVAAVADGAGLPWIAVRSVADTASDRLPAVVLDNLAGDGTVDVSGVLRASARSPLQMRSLIRLGRNHARAGRALEAAARTVGPRLLVPVTAAIAREAP